MCTTYVCSFVKDLSCMSLFRLVSQKLCMSPLMNPFLVLQWFPVILLPTGRGRTRVTRHWQQLFLQLLILLLYKQQRFEMMAREDACKEKAEACCDAQEVREQEHLSIEQQSNGLGQYERLCALIRKNCTDLKDSTLDYDEREDFVRSNKLLIKRIHIWDRQQL